MIEVLNTIRTSHKEMKLKNKILNTVFITVLGIVLGIFSKWLDNLSIDNTIWWQDWIDKLDLRNFFSGMSVWLLLATGISILSNSPLRASLNTFFFLIGMTISYHIYTVVFSGFNPLNYMKIWYGITFASPILAYICWYAKGENKISMSISSIIFWVMFSVCFNIGQWYFDWKSILDTIAFIGTCVVLYSRPKNMLMNILIGLVLAFMIRIPFLVG